MAITLAAPIARVALGGSPRYRALRGRFSPELPGPMEKPIWVHACSIGELNVATPLIRAMEKRWTKRPVLLTVSTVSGHAMAREGIGRDRLAWFPVDAPRIARAAIERFDPSLLVLVETELWPNVIRSAHEGGVPVCVVNGRISAKHFPRMQKMGALGARMTQQIDLVAAQSDEHAERFKQIGVPEERVAVTGNIKYDAVASEPSEESRKRVTCILGDDACPALVFGSTRPGDEELALETWQNLRNKFPDLRLVIAPRHIDRADEIARLLPEPLYRRSKSGDESAPKDAIILVDVFGELVAWYARATVAVLGGSFYPGVEGHNPLEPAALGTPIVFGPYMGNFRDAKDRLLEAGGAVQAPSPDSLSDALAELLREPERAARLADCARSTIATGRGAIDSTLNLIEEAGYARDFI